MIILNEVKQNNNINLWSLIYFWNGVSLSTPWLFVRSPLSAQINKNQYKNRCQRRKMLRAPLLTLISQRFINHNHKLKIRIKQQIKRKKNSKRGKQYTKTLILFFRKPGIHLASLLQFYRVPLRYQPSLGLAQRSEKIVLTALLEHYWEATRSTIESPNRTDPTNV